MAEVLNVRKVIGDFMVATDLKEPTFKVLADKSSIILANTTMRLGYEGWYPIGEPAKKGKDWIQVLVKEGKDGQ